MRGKRRESGRELAGRGVLTVLNLLETGKEGSSSCCLAVPLQRVTASPPRLNPHPERALKGAF